MTLYKYLSDIFPEELEYLRVKKPRKCALILFTSPSKVRFYNLYDKAELPRPFISRVFDHSKSSKIFNSIQANCSTSVRFQISKGGKKHLRK